MRESLSQKIILILFFAGCAAGLMQFYRHMVWQANEDINGAAAVSRAYNGSRR